MNWGVALVFSFVVAAAARDVFFGGIFQQYRFFDVILVSFSLCSVLFVAFVAVFMRDQFAELRRAWREALASNIGTALAWLSYFHALKTLEPSVVHTIHAGAGSITLIALGAMGVHISRPARVAPVERLLSLGVLISLLAISAIVLLDLSGLPQQSTTRNLIGLALAFASGVFIAVSTSVSVRMNEMGVAPEGVLAVRFIAIVAIAGIIVAAGAGDGAPIPDFRTLGELAGASLLLLVVPLYLLHLGLARTTAVSAWIIMAIGPCLVFAGQLVEGRVLYSGYSLTCILLYSTILANLARRFERN